MIEEVSCIRFKPQTEVHHKDFIEFVHSRGCYSFVGRSGDGKQEIFLRSECAQAGTHVIAHQVIYHQDVPKVNVFLLRLFKCLSFKIFHTLGFYHEHQRPDRDQYIKINWNEIPQSLETHFLKMDERFLGENFLSEYDFESIMHYDSYLSGAFFQPAMNKLDGTVIEVNKKLSDLDIVSLNKLYPCKNSCENENNQS